jgi:ABC-2 type transport system ATP-binding protein
MGEGNLITVDTPDGLRRRAFGGDMVDLRTTEPMDARSEYLMSNQPFVLKRITHVGDRTMRLVVNEGSTAIPQILDWCKANNISVESIEEYMPPFDDVFVELVEEERERG